MERRWRATERTILAVLTLFGTALFWATNLDLTAAHYFYHPAGSDPWPVAGQPIFQLFYRSAPWITGSLAVCASALLVAGLVRRGSRRMRLYGLFIILCVILGPGLLVNGLLKDHWGRPRPRQVQELGGIYPYVPPLLRAATPGKSFPCGHCSVGFLYSLGWWIWRRRHPRLARASLAVGLGLGSLLGLGRMAAGGHFLSDVVWAGLISFWVAHGLYHHWLRIPEHEPRGHPIFRRVESGPHQRAFAVSLAVLLGLGVIGGGILATPQFKDLQGRHPLADCPEQPCLLQLDLDQVDLELRLVDTPDDAIESTGWINGFGLPGNDIEASWHCLPGDVPVLSYRLTERGWFTDLDGTLRMYVPRLAFRRIRVRTETGDIRILRPPGRDRAAEVSLPELDLHTRHGRIDLSAGIRQNPGS
jgi:membrane-associated PAP2 superfamily phosphatase